ncbi:transmembrane protein 254 isoform X1 [Pan troglodytes]|nr:transmembrane protein 254 isoform X1 [Pan troglodytes]
MITSPPDLSPGVIPRPLYWGQTGRLALRDFPTSTIFSLRGWRGSAGRPRPCLRARARRCPEARSRGGVAAMATAAGATYFQRGSLFWFTVITLSFGYYTWVVFWPQSIPYQNLGPLGPFTQYLVDHHHTLLCNGYWLAWLIHVGESLYAIVLCKHKGITSGRAQLLWFLQTFFFGIASLTILIAYKRKRQKQT